ncbi:DegV family protein [Angustibacter sp. McL0619]|uniref:DegV family protein n=1 Tax=Angustibacter sp. McL0619 TaxID=3415676 RepID=UPI003CE92811
MAVAVVTDSTASLSPLDATAAGVQVVPLQVVVGGTAYEEGVEITSAQVATALRAGTALSTSRPSPQLFLDAYTAAAEAGADSVVSLHISAALSGTYESALLAARDSPIPAHVVDSRSMGMGLGFLVLQAARSAADGADVQAVAQAARARARGSRAYFFVGTLEHLRRGGRIGPAAAFVGSALAIKPLLVLDDGIISPLEKVRTSSRALARLADLAVTEVGDRAAEVAVHHLDAAERATALADGLRARLPKVANIQVSDVGAVIGTHVGPGMVAVVVVPGP